MGKKFTFKRPATELIRLKGEKRMKRNTYTRDTNKKPTIAEINGMWEESGGMHVANAFQKGARTPLVIRTQLSRQQRQEPSNSHNKFKNTKREKVRAKKVMAERKTAGSIETAEFIEKNARRKRKPQQTLLLLQPRRRRKRRKRARKSSPR